MATIHCPQCQTEIECPIESVFETAANLPPPTGAAPGIVQRVTVSEVNRFQKWVLAIMTPYAVMMSVFAVHFYIRYQGTESHHPLAMIPDLDGEYRNLTQKNRSVTQHRTRFDPDTQLDDKLTTQLGRPLTIGDIEVTPLSIDRKPITAFSLRKGHDAPEQTTSKNEGLVMRLRIKNVSKETTLYPNDPYFVRRSRDDKDRTYHMLDLAGRKIYGGVLPYPLETEFAVREWVDGQQHDHEPLAPGQERETVVATHPRSGAVEAVRSGEQPCVWRVQVRRGFVRFRGKEYAVSAVFGVQFQPGDVRQAS